jgi:hypothetical protein
MLIHLLVNTGLKRRQDLNLRPLGYEPNELPLLYIALFLVLKTGLPTTAFSRLWALAAFSGLQPSLARRRTILGLAATYAYFVARPFPLSPGCGGVSLI